MALIYEHWRPDTNECFYVGASRDAEDSRPYYYGSHNDDYDAVVVCLKQNGMEPFTKLVWTDLERDCVGTYEKIRIAYHRALLGKKLTNKAKGGDGFNVEWSEEMRLKQSETLSNYMNEFYQTDQGLERRQMLSSNMSKKMEQLISEIGLENYSKQVSERLIAYFQTPEGLAQAERHSATVGASLKQFYESEEGSALKKHFSETRTAFFQTSEGDERRKKHAQGSINFYASEQGEITKKHLSDVLIAFHQTPEGEEWRKNASSRMKDWWNLLSDKEKEEFCSRKQSMWDNKTAEDRKRHSNAVANALAKLPKGYLSQKAKEWQASRTFEERSASAKKIHAAIPFEERSKVAKERQAKKTPAQRSESTQKGWETRRRNKELAAVSDNKGQ